MRIAEYVSARSLDEAIAILAADGSARALAGGNSLLVEPSRGRLQNAKLVDLGRIAGLAGIQSEDGGLRIGAMTPLAAIAADKAVAQQYPALAEAVNLIGDAQVRNRATLGGNLAEGEPGADLPAVMIALGAQVHVQGSKGSRAVSAEEVAAGALAQGELITGVSLPRPAPRTGAAYEKFKHPATLYAICGVAASVTLGANGVDRCVVAVVGATEAPTRLRGVEAALQGKGSGPSEVAAAAKQSGEGASFRGDHFASPEYRRHLTGVLAQRALAKAIERAG